MGIFNELDADLFRLQGTKLQAGQIDLELPDYYQYWSYAEKEGHSGAATFAKEEVLSVRYDLGVEARDQKGRVIILGYPEFLMVTCYTPNSQAELKYLAYRMIQGDAFRAYLNELNQEKPVILRGDLNTVHQSTDLKSWKTNQKNAGSTPEERQKFTELLDSDFADIFHHFYSETGNIYSWWSYRLNVQGDSAGRRIDYFVMSESPNECLVSAKIHIDILDNDHCPVEVVFDL